MDHSHLALVGVWIKRNWYWLSGSVVLFWYSIKWMFYKIISNHPTLNQMEDAIGKVRHEIEDVKHNLANQLEQHEKTEFARQDKLEGSLLSRQEVYRKETMDSFSRLTTKVDDLTKVIIETIRDNRK